SGPLTETTDVPIPSPAGEPIVTSVTRTGPPPPIRGLARRPVPPSLARLRSPVVTPPFAPIAPITPSTPSPAPTPPSAAAGTPPRRTPTRVPRLPPSRR